MKGRCRQFRTGAAQQEVGGAEVAHFPLDDEIEPPGQVALEQRPVEVARVIGNHDAVVRREVVHPRHANVDHREYEDHAGRPGDQFLPPFRGRHDEDDDQAEEDHEAEGKPREQAPERFQAAIDPVHFMSMPSIICDSGHARTLASPAYSETLKNPSLGDACDPVCYQ